MDIVGLLQTFKAKLEAALVGQEFAAEAGGIAVPAVHLGTLPSDTNAPAAGKHHPFVVVRAMAGQDSRDLSLVTVRLFCGIYTAGDTVAGLTDIHKLGEVCLSLQKSGGFSPFVLQAAASWQAGDENGDQPHPYYQVAIDYQFKHPARK